MYVTTFYSFKGGVGRSMALANAAVELAQRGRRVLVVDFDLEAPGLDTFDVLRPRKDVPGIIDFVHEYLSTDRSPDAARFLARLPDVGDRGGQLWIMPSGAQQATYAAHFNQIDWAELYEKRDGYLLFEDLKAQWGRAVAPDYVLIDSRTGHTDTGGICTRQLPDAVAILFFPNEQNLRGLTKVVRDIRAEAENDKEIALHFIMSNVPDLDDEDRILEDHIQAFRKQLHMTGKRLIVHRYDSLALLNQAVFTLTRPRSRLAREYDHVVNAIVGRNLDDRDGALRYIERNTRPWRQRDEEPLDALKNKLHSIGKTHAEDGEVLFELGRLKDRDPRLESDGSLFDRAIESGYREPEVYVQRAQVRSRNGDLDGANEDALRALQSGSAPPPLIWRAAALTTSGGAEAVAASPAVMSLDVGERIALASGLDEWPDQIEVSVPILKRITSDPDVSEDHRKMARAGLATRLIATRACDEAARMLRHGDRSVTDMNIRDAFNYGMAMWGATGAIDPDPFTRVVGLHRAKAEERSDPNYWQCMAVAFWAIGEASEAAASEERARAAVNGPHVARAQLRPPGAASAAYARRRRGVAEGPVFSYWRYAAVPASDFGQDLDDIKALMSGDTTRLPHFMRDEPRLDDVFSS